MIDIHIDDEGTRIDLWDTPRLDAAAETILAASLICDELNFPVKDFCKLLIKANKRINKIKGGKNADT